MKKRNNNKKNVGASNLQGDEEKEMYACQVWGLQTRLGKFNKPCKTKKMTSSK